jgi:hypothetical protein
VILLVPRVAVGENFPEKPGADTRRIAISARGIQSTSFPSIEQSPGSSPWFKDMGIGVSYALSDDKSIGLEAGQESFAQEYTGQENGRTVHYKQRPLLFWAGVAYQQSLETIRIGNQIVPFFKVAVGATQVGPIGRLTAGLLYHADSRTTFSLGMEGAWLPYPFQGAWFIGSRNLGATYGVSLLF